MSCHVILKICDLKAAIVYHRLIGTRSNFQTTLLPAPPPAKTDTNAPIY